MTLSIDIPFEHALAVATADGVVHAQGDLGARFPLASVTKPIAAWSALVASDRGLLALDDPAGPPGATVRHLLAHASGLPLDKREPLCAPGKRRVYSNAGFDVLGDVLAEATGSPVGRWIEEAVFEPLGMASAEVPGSPARSGVASVEDLLALGRQMLSPTLIGRALSEEATTVQFPELAGVVPGYGRHVPCPWGLGVEIKGAKSPHWTAPSAPASTFGHFGVSGSFLWVDRESGVFGAFLGAEDFGPWHKEHWSPLNEELLALVIGER